MQNQSDSLRDAFGFNSPALQMLNKLQKQGEALQKLLGPNSPTLEMLDMIQKQKELLPNSPLLNLINDVNSTYSNNYSNITKHLPAATLSFLAKMNQISVIDYSNMSSSYKLSRDLEEIAISLIDEDIDSTIIDESIYVDIENDTIEVFEGLKQNLILLFLELSKLNDKHKLLPIFFNIISLIGIYISVKGSLDDATRDKKTTELHAELIEKIKIQSEISIDKILNTVLNEVLTPQNKRLARTNVNLRKTPNKKAPTIGLVKADQEVTVLEIRHKYLLIAYIDYETNEPKSGFVVKKYFYEEK